ncbi:MAG TPA: MiaB/RimO family radical SAM methylthiotransferase [Gemmatimonadaceae bacterium]|nr:MiaB/RimO family radical SAM methylthiotransferase [Gemmatimonadaceae bacterium]
MKIHLRTFGCRANHYDTERVRAMALAAGHEIVDDVAGAELAVFNSCAVTAEAERDLRRAVRGAARRNPGLRSVVMGCAAALPHNEPVLRALPTVETLVAGADGAGIARAIGAGTDPDVEVATRRQESARAVLRIQDGCDEHCTFCTTTHARGANRSRGIPELVREAEALAEHHPEIVLTGTHIGTYGTDTGSSLGELVQVMIDRVPAIRFRLSSVEATELDDRLVEMLVDGTRLVPHLHAPLQSGSDRLLRRMGRHWYTSASYARGVERIAKRRSVFGLGADVIVGFPGETDADFADTMAVVHDLPFTYLHVFPYSARPGTAATRLPDAVAPALAAERSARLRQLAADKTQAYQRGRCGAAADLIVVTAPPSRQAMTEDFLTVPFAGARPRGERFRGTLAWTNGSLAAA